jgi:small subunit ribosomal protein S4
MLLQAGDEVSVREGSAGLTYFTDLTALAETRNSPAWLSRDPKKLSGAVARLPERAEIDANLNEQLIVEYYSRR